MAEDFGVEDRGHFYDPVGALRDVVVNHLMQVVAASRWRRRRGATRRRSRTRRSRSSARSRRPTRRTTFAASTTATSSIDGVAAGLDHRDLRRAAARDRELALGGRAVLHPRGEAAARDPDRAAARLQAASRLGFAPPTAAGAEPARGQARPVDGDPPSSSTPIARTGRRGEDQARHGVRTRRAAKADALRGAAARRARRRQQPLHPTGRRGGDVAGDAAAARRAATCPPTRRARGARTRQTRSSPGYGRWHGPWIAT